MNRRELVFGASSLAIVAASPSIAAPLPLAAARKKADVGTSPNPGQLTFFGNPNVAISAIDTTGGIVSSRDNDGSRYQTPFFIQVSASAIKATGTVAPYEDLSFSWDFGDPNGNENFIRPTDGATVNANSAQNSPEAVYCYRSSGTYVITLTITGKNASGYITAQVKKSITVLPFAPTTTSLWVDQVNGNDANLGTSPGAPKKSIAAINSAIGSNRIIYLARGSRWTGSTGIVINGASISGFRIAAYGTGPNPIVEITSGNQVLGFLIQNGGSSSPSTVQDIVISNLDVLNSGSMNGAAGAIGTGNATAKMSNIYFDNCNWSITFDQNTQNPCIFGAPNPPMENTPYLHSNIGWWKNSFTNSPSSKTIGIGLMGSAQNWSFVVGGTFAGAGTDPTYDHHIYPETRNHSLFKWIAFGPTGTGAGQRNFCINGNWDAPYLAAGTNQTAQYHTISENSFQYTCRTIDLGNRTNNTYSGDSTVQFQYVVIERNAEIGFSVYGSMLWGCALSVTIRDERVWNFMGGAWYVPPTGQLASVDQKTNLITRIYRNRIYSASGPVGALVSYADQGWTQPQQITDNIFCDARSAPTFCWIVANNQLAAKSIIDRNQYWSTAAGWPGTSLTWLNGTTGVNFTQWKAYLFDYNGSQTKPTWTLPPTKWNDLGP